MALTYIDSSSLLKTLWNEPESAAVRTAVAAAHRLIVSALTELEVEVQLRARLLAGSTTKPQYRAYRNRLASFRDVEPFEFSDVPGAVFRLALEQHGSSSVHCRTLDRLHLAAMEHFGARRLMTNDGKQATAARSLGYEVVVPGS
jgi:predicted nucleic acid-binding protein